MSNVVLAQGNISAIIVPGYEKLDLAIHYVCNVVASRQTRVSNQIVILCHGCNRDPAPSCRSTAARLSFTFQGCRVCWWKVF